MYQPSTTSRYMDAQQSWFSVHTSADDDSDFVSINELNFPEYWGALLKIVIPKDKKVQIINQLRNIGIDESTVYPSLHHTANDIRSELVLNKLFI